jgi:hypothetical protein
VTSSFAGRRSNPTELRLQMDNRESGNQMDEGGGDLLLSRSGGILIQLNYGCKWISGIEEREYCIDFFVFAILSWKIRNPKESTSSISASRRSQNP